MRICTSPLQLSNRIVGLRIKDSGAPDTGYEFATCDIMFWPREEGAHFRCLDGGQVCGGILSSWLLLVCSNPRTVYSSSFIGDIPVTIQEKSYQGGVLLTPCTAVFGKAAWIADTDRKS